MRKFIQLFVALGALALSANHASALSVSTAPIFVSGPTDEFVFSYTGSDTNFTLSNLSFSSGSGNLLTTLSPYTTSAGGTLTGNSGSLTEVISATPGVAYTVSYALNGAVLPGSINISVAAVPLPPSAPLFALALLALGVMGYRRARTDRGFAA